VEVGGGTRVDLDLDALAPAWHGALREALQ
jgi:hypothetical protein